MLTLSNLLPAHPRFFSSSLRNKVLLMAPTRRSTRLAASLAVTHAITVNESDALDVPRAPKRTKISVKTAEISDTGDHATIPAVQPKPNKRGRNTKTKADPDPADYRARATSPWKVGAHVSAAGGVENAVQNAAQLGANAFALFLKSQRKWASPALTPASIAAFKSRMAAFGYAPAQVLPHGSYLINLGNPDAEKREKSYQCFVDDLRRCEQLGLVLYNFHPGSTVGLTTRAESIALIAESLNRAHRATAAVVTVIENMAGAGNVIGATFADLADIVRGVEDKARVGVCLDTCHMFAAGYDIRTKAGWDSILSGFDAQVGLAYLRGMHLNDSKTPLGSKRDRHENIGIGHIGLVAFRHVLRDPRVRGIPVVLETPSFEGTEVWTKEVEVLNRLSALGLDGLEDEDEGDGQAMEAMADEIREVVRRASGAQKGKGAGARGGKRGRKDAAEEEEQGEEQHECDH